MKYYRTKRCVGCGRKRIKSQTGHLHYFDKKITASWCSKDCLMSTLMNGRKKCEGCYGGAVSAHGIVMVNE